MAKDIRISTRFTDHPKTLELIDLLGSEAVICLIRLWSYAAEYRTKGTLEKMDVKRIETAARWGGEAGRFVAALIQVGFLDQKRNSFSLHDWRDHQGFIFYSKERQKNSLKALKVRWENHHNRLKNKAVMDATTRSTGSTTNRSQKSTTPFPSPLPSPSPSPSPTRPRLDTPTPDGESGNQSIKSQVSKIVSLWNETMGQRLQPKTYLETCKKRQAKDPDLFDKLEQAIPIVKDIDDSSWTNSVNFSWLLRPGRNGDVPVIDRVLAGDYSKRKDKPGPPAELLADYLKRTEGKTYGPDGMESGN